MRGECGRVCEDYQAGICAWLVVGSLHGDFGIVFEGKKMHAPLTRSRQGALMHLG